MRTVLKTMVLPFLLLTACGKSSDGSDAVSFYKSAASSNAGMVFATVDLKFTAAQIWFADFTKGALTQIASGESGDPALLDTGDALLLFNRSPTNLNFRTLTPLHLEAAADTQKPTPAAASGDPAAAITLSENRMLLAHNNAGLLTVVDRSSGALLQTISAEWDLGTVDGAALRPAAFVVRPAAEGRDIYVLHQGLDKAYESDDTQQVFVLHDDGKTVTATDLDPATAKVQGIKLNFSNPQGFLDASGDEATVIGGCTLFMLKPCKPGVERVDFAKHTATVVYDMSAATLKENGGFVSTGNGVFYGLMAQATTGSDYSAAVAKIDTTAKTTAVLHDFPKGSPGCCSMLLDPSTGALFVGDSRADGTGFYDVYDKEDASPVRFELQGRPHAGVFIKK